MRKKEISEKDWYGQKEPWKLGKGTKNIIYSGKEPNPIFKASGWKTPMFYFYSRDYDDVDKTTAAKLYIQNINLQFDSFENSVIKLDTGVKKFHQRPMLVLNKVNGYFNNGTGDSAIFISSGTWWGDDGGDNFECKNSYKNDDTFHNLCVNTNDIKINNIMNCICPTEYDPARAPQLSILNSNLTFDSNIIGPIKHGGAAIYVKDGAFEGGDYWDSLYGSGTVYKNSNLTFSNNKVTLTNNRDDAYKQEGGGAIRTSFLVGGGPKGNTLKFTKNTITGGKDDLGARGGALYVNDGWWCHQGDGDTIITANGNKADKGSVAFMDQDSSGGTFFNGNCSGNMSSPNDVTTLDNSGSSDRHCGNVKGANFPEGCS